MKTSFLVKKSLCFIFITLSLSCCTVKTTRQISTSTPLKESPEKVLASIIKMEIPRIEKKSNHVKIKIWAMRPSFEYSKEEVQISKIQIGYNIKIWLHKNTPVSDKLTFYKEVSFKIPRNGGYDIEVSGKNQNLIDIVFIDAK